VLAHELIGLTGRADATEALVRLLESWMGSTRGLPQGPSASNVLADIYISPAARALDRAGFRFRRYSDDFRVLATTWREAREAQLVLERALYDLGLAAAPGKARTLKLETYQIALSRVNDPRLQSPVVREAFDELEAEDYVPQLAAPVTVSPEEVTRAAEVVQEITPLSVNVLTTRLLRRAIPTLAVGRSRAVLDRFPILLAKYAHLTPVMASYFRQLMGSDAEHDAVEAVASALRSESFKFPWQIGWLFSAVSHAHARSTTVADLAAEALESDALPWFARGQAALALAVHGRLPRPTEYVDVYELSSRAVRPDLVAAVGVGSPPWRSPFLRSIASESPVLASVQDLPIDSYREWV
jgi:hypothetical protein